MLYYSITRESELIEIATKYTVVHIAYKLLDNHALTLLSTHSTPGQLDKLLPMSSLQHRPDKLGTPRWLLSQLSPSLQHMSYTCKVKKAWYNTIQARERNRGPLTCTLFCQYY